MSDHFIGLPQAIEMTTRYRSKKETILDPAYRGKDILLLSETFGREAFDALLSEQDCTSIRIYFGMNENLQVRAIIVGANSKNEDLLPQAGLMIPASTGSKIVEEGTPCPPACPPPSPLNG
ncbi:MAG TPA: hypothetical protein VK588_07880 [Chitinophagaceae bacterium]|nr:hypothetical protein [Chitinophagaceae bacterium]